jgi:hypothetical protein
MADAEVQVHDHLFPPRFIFHGNAVGAEVIIHRIGKERVNRVSPAQGQSSLPVIGGHSESFVEKSDDRFNDVFSYGECRTQARGVVEDLNATTEISASVRDLSMVNRPSPGEAEDLRPIEFRAGLLGVAVTSLHPRRGQARIEYAEPQIEGLSLDGRPIELELRRQFLDLHTMGEIEEQFRTVETFFHELRNAFMRRDPGQPLQFGERIPRMRHHALTSIVRAIRWGDERIEGHVLSKTGFGRIYFGEMLIHEHNRRLTLVRVKMGSDTDADGSFGESDPNGDWWPPET